MKLVFKARLKSWGKDYPVDADGNVKLGEPPNTYYATFYLLGAEGDKGQFPVSVCKACIPQLEAKFEMADLSSLENSTIFQSAKITFEFDETGE